MLLMCYVISHNTSLTSTPVLNTNSTSTINSTFTFRNSNTYLLLNILYILETFFEFHKEHTYRITSQPTSPSVLLSIIYSLLTKILEIASSWDYKFYNPHRPGSQHEAIYFIRMLQGQCHGYASTHGNAQYMRLPH